MVLLGAAFGAVARGVVRRRAPARDDALMRRHRLVVAVVFPFVVFAGAEWLPGGPHRALVGGMVGVLGAAIVELVRFLGRVVPVRSARAVPRPVPGDPPERAHAVARHAGPGWRREAGRQHP